MCPTKALGMTIILGVRDIPSIIPAASGGPARTFPGCSLTDPAGTGNIGFSRCMIDASDNSSAGARLGQFYTSQRVDDYSGFYVNVVP